MSRLAWSPAAALLLAALSLPAAAKGGPVCYGFDRQPEGAQWGVGDTIRIDDLGRVEVRDLLVDGKPYAPETRFLRRVGNAIAGGSAPAVYAKNVTLRMVPKAPVTRISMRLAQQPGAAGARPASVEVNGERHEFAGSLEQLDGKVLGGMAAARLKVRLPVSDGAFDVGQLVVESKAGIRSFSIGAAELHLDDVCFER
jgi:hypothetical protein